MRHRVAKRHFNRDTNHRKALLMNLVRSLVERGEIVTTTSKAKETKRIADRVIFKAKSDTLYTKRVLHKFFGKRDVVNTLVNKIAPAMGKRTSGFTSVKRAGVRRGDNSELSRLSFVVKVEGLGTLKSGKDYSKTTKKAVKKAKVSKIAKTKK